MSGAIECTLLEHFRAAVDELARKGGGTGALEFHVGPLVPGRPPAVEFGEVVQRVRPKGKRG